jgi:hypothetical protein
MCRGPVRGASCGDHDKPAAEGTDLLAGQWEHRPGGLGARDPHGTRILDRLGSRLNTGSGMLLRFELNRVGVCCCGQRIVGFDCGSGGIREPSNRGIEAQNEQQFGRDTHAERVIELAESAVGNRGG